nr:hypothetical protein [Pseudobutyrivibrio sp.]
DANDDGTLENIYVTNTVDEDAMEVVYTLHLGDQELAYNADSSMYYVSFYYVHSAGGNFVFADASMDNGFNETTLYKVGDTIKEIDKNEYAVSEISDGTLKMTAIRDALGTWTVIDEFSYDANGFTRKNTAEKIDNNPSSNSDARGIKLKADMEYLLDYNDKDSTQTIESGSLIYPVTIIDSSDGTVIGFVTEDGITGYVYYKEDSSTGSHTINGIDEMELFEELPYAG